MKHKSRYNIYSLNILFKFVLTISLAVVPTLLTKTAYAAPFATSTCDPEYMKSLNARAWLEAQREITQNQNLIVKPDSVLEYSCFDSHLNHLEDAASNLFSEDSSRWGTAAGNMGSALSSLQTANSNYIDSNFDHDFVGGRKNVTVNSGNTTYECDAMFKVWQEAKCMNFLDKGHDGFFTLTQYAGLTDGQDYRKLPAVCTGVQPYTNNINEAVGSTTPWNEDEAQTYFYLFDRSAETDKCGNNPPSGGGSISKIATGLEVFTDTGSVTNYDEQVCLVPGCYFDPDANECKLP